MSRFALGVRHLSVMLLTLLPFSLCGCPGGGASGKFVSIGTARQGGAFYQVGAAIANALNDGKGTGGWTKATAEVSGGTLANLRRLESSDIEIGMANSSISYLAVQGVGFDKKYEVKSIMTLFPLIAMFVTKSDSGIKSIKDLKGKRVIIGPQGAGFEHFVKPILAKHDVEWDDIDVQYAGFSDSVGYLQDGTAAAAFLGGGPKSPAITSAATSMSIILVPYEEEARRKLIEEFPSFSGVVVKGKTYKGVNEDFAGLNVGSAQLLVRADAPDDFVRNVVKVIWEHRKKIAETHAGGKSINEKNVARHVGVDFHPAASKFYKEELKIGGGSSPGKSKSQ